MCQDSNDKLIIFGADAEDYKLYRAKQMILNELLKEVEGTESKGNC